MSDVAVGLSRVMPRIALVDRGGAVNAGVWKQRDVHGVVGVVMADYYIGDFAGFDAEGAKWVEDVGLTGHHAWVDDDVKTLIGDVNNAAGNVAAAVSHIAFNKLVPNCAHEISI